MRENCANIALSDYATVQQKEREKWAKILAPSKQRKEKQTEKQKEKKRSIFSRFFGL